MNKKILITGASGGFGFLTCKELRAKGHQVTGTMRKADGKNDIKAEDLRRLGVHIVEMDVTDESSVNNGVQEAIEKMGGLDVLINNAGVGVLGMQEHFTPKDMQKVFDVNVFGVQRVTRAVLPFLRNQGKGTLLFVSSLLGRVSMPFYGIYNASKWAVEALAENYRVELSHFGIECCIVEPGGYPTTFMENLVKPSDRSRNKSYGSFMREPNAMFEGYQKSMEHYEEQRPENVAKGIVNLIDMPFGDKPMRKVIDFMGMGEYIEDYNEKFDKITYSLYSAFGNEGMLSVKQPLVKEHL